MEQGANSETGIIHATVVSLPDEDHNSQLDHRRCKRCRGVAQDDSDYCQRHEQAVRRYQRDYDHRRRERYEAEGRCTRCGAKERKRDSMWCTACVIRYLRVDHKQKLDQQSESRRDRIAKRLIPWTNSPQNEGRLRMRGGKRGAPSARERDQRDLADIRRILDRYEMALDEAYSAETAALSRIARLSAARAAHAGLALAVRLGMEALVTYGYECPVLAEDFEPDGDGIDADHVSEIVKSGR